jgi:hypothetical protein
MTSTDAPSSDDRCSYCGAIVPDDDWLGIELQRPVVLEDGSQRDFPDYLQVVFCGQDHAARWLVQPLPPPEAVTTTDLKTPWSERLLLAAIVFSVLWVLAFFGLGVWTAAQWLLQR